MGRRKAADQRRYYRRRRLPRARGDLRL